jgi:hypothetical protein
MEYPVYRQPLDYPRQAIESKIIILGLVIGRRSITLRLPPLGPVKNIYLNSIAGLTMLV